MSQQAQSTIIPSFDSIKSALGMATSLPKSYKVAIFEEKDKPLTIKEVEMKEPAAGELLIKVEACGVCHSDAEVKAGHFGNSL